MLGKYVAYRIGKRSAYKKMEKEQLYAEVEAEKEALIEAYWKKNARDTEEDRPPTYE